MNAVTGSTAAKGVRGWWLSPPRAGLHRLINPWEYRHLRLFGLMRVAGGSVAAAAGIVCLSYGVYGWAAFFLVIGALNLGGGYWYITIARSGSSRPQRQLRLWTLKEPEIECHEHQDDSDIRYQPLPDAAPEDQNVDANYDDHHRGYVKPGGCLASHRFLLLRATERGESVADFVNARAG